MGATLALPLLDAMVPAFGPAASAATPTRRFGAMFVPLGERPGFWDADDDRRRTSSSTPIMKPLEEFRSHMTVVSQLCDPLDGHATTVAAWLSGAIPKRTLAENVHNGVTVDQVIADQIGQDTPMQSLELATEDFTGWIGGCDPSYSCAYMNTHLVEERRPRRCRWRSTRAVVFERMFGRPGTSAQRLGADGRPTAASSTRCSRSWADCSTGSARKDRNRLNDYRRERPRDRAAHPEGREAVGDQRRGAGRAGRHPGGVRGSRRADVST